MRLASTVQTRDRSPAASTDHGVACTDKNAHLLTVQNPLVAAGAVVLDCRPPVVAGIDGH